MIDIEAWAREKKKEADDMQCGAMMNGDTWRMGIMEGKIKIIDELLNLIENDRTQEESFEEFKRRGMIE